MFHGPVNTTRAGAQSTHRAKRSGWSARSIDSWQNRARLGPHYCHLWVIYGSSAGEPLVTLLLHARVRAWGLFSSNNAKSQWPTQHPTRRARKIPTIVLVLYWQ